MFLDILELTVKNKNSCLGKTVSWSQMLKKSLRVHKTTFRKKKKKIKNIKKMKTFTIFGGF